MSVASGNAGLPSASSFEDACVGDGRGQVVLSDRRYLLTPGAGYILALNCLVYGPLSAKAVVVEDRR